MLTSNFIHKTLPAFSWWLLVLGHNLLNGWRRIFLIIEAFQHNRWRSIYLSHLLLRVADAWPSWNWHIVMRRFWITHRIIRRWARIIWARSWEELFQRSSHLLLFGFFFGIFWSFQKLQFVQSDLVRYFIQRQLLNIFNWVLLYLSILFIKRALAFRLNIFDLRDLLNLQLVLTV